MKSKITSELISILVLSGVCVLMCAVTWTQANKNEELETALVAVSADLSEALLIQSEDDALALDWMHGRHECLVESLEEFCQDNEWAPPRDTVRCCDASCLGTMLAPEDYTGSPAVSLITELACEREKLDLESDLRVCRELSENRYGQKLLEMTNLYLACKIEKKHADLL